jgi:hypothetical protein
LAQPRSGLAWLVAVAVKQGGWRRRAGEYKAQKLLRPCFGVDVNAVVVLPAAAIDKLTAPWNGDRDSVTCLGQVTM